MENQNLEARVKEIESKKIEIISRTMLIDKKYGFDIRSHFRHITGNLMGAIYKVADLKYRDNETINKALKEIELYETYFSLLKEYPDFVEGESKEEGAFPDIRDTGTCNSSGAENYILEAEKRLKK